MKLTEIIISDLQDKVKIEEDTRSLLKRLIKFALTKEGKDSKVEVSLVFVDNDHIKRLNKTYRGLEEATDVLSFAMGEGDAIPFDLDFPEPAMLGDIVISLEQAQKQAVDYNHSLKREISYLTVHGILHLLGYDHETDTDKKIMRSKEEDILRAFDLKRE